MQLQCPKTQAWVHSLPHLRQARVLVALHLRHKLPRNRRRPQDHGYSRTKTYKFSRRRHPLKR